MTSTDQHSGILKLLPGNADYEIEILDAKRSSRATKYRISADDQTLYFAKTVSRRFDIPAFTKLYQSSHALPSDTVYLPELVAAAEQHLVYQWVDCTPILKPLLLLSLTRQLKKPSTWMRSLGSWLGNFHRTTPADLPRSVIHSAWSIDDTAAAKLQDTPVCKTFNDFTLRNFMLDSSGRLMLLDIDAAFHPKFPGAMYPYHDLAILAVNLYGLSKVPGISFSITKRLYQHFLHGYFESFDFEYDCRLMNYFIRQHFAGNFMDRPLSRLYSGRLNNAYIKRLDHTLKSDSHLFEYEQLPV